MTAPVIDVYTAPCRYCRARPGTGCRGGYPTKAVKPHAIRVKDALVMSTLLNYQE